MPIQTKLTVGAADDQYEQEADRVALQVVSTPALSSVVTDQTSVQRRAFEEEAPAQAKPLSSTITPLVQRATSGPSGSFEPGTEFESRMSTDGSGSPLPAGTRAFMEPRFGADFSAVRLHTGNEAGQLNRAVGAQAFTHGHDIYLGDGKDNLNSSAGKQLLAHELTHTIQQGAISSNAAVSSHSNVARSDGFAEQPRQGIGNISQAVSGVVQRSWVGDRIEWVRAAIRADNWAGSDPPGAYYVLNGLSMDDMIKVLRALSSTDRKQLSDNLDENGGGFDRSRLQLALTNAVAPATDKVFREQSENLHWAIRNDNFAAPPDGAFNLLASVKVSQRDKLLAALNRDALDALIAHREDANSVTGGAEIMTAIDRKRGGVQPTGRERRLLDLIDDKAWDKFFEEFNPMNETDQLRFLSGNFGAVAQIRTHIGSAEWGGDRDRMRYLLERATTMGSTDLYVDASVHMYRWQPKYRVENTADYSRYVSFGNAFNAEIDINTIDDGEISEDAAQQQKQDAQPGPGGFLWPARRNKSTLPVLWRVKQDVRKNMETLLLDPVLKAGIMVVNYLLTVVFPVVQGATMRSLAALRRASLSGRWMQGANILKTTAIADAEAFTQARNARNTMVDAFNQMPAAQQQEIATVTGGVNVETGQVAGGYNRGGLCAEKMVVERLGGDASKVRFSEAVRPRTGQQVMVCETCQGAYPRNQFPEGAIFKGEGIKMPKAGE